jgi:hypothetical protein
MDGIFPALLREIRRNVVLTSSGFFVPAYVPAIWRQVKVMFILKPGRNSYSGPRDFIPISPTSFFRKTMGRLVDGFLRDEIFACAIISQSTRLPGWKIRGNGPSSARGSVEKTLDQQETVLDVFLDTEGAFNSTSYDSTCAARFKHGVGNTIAR